MAGPHHGVMAISKTNRTGQDIYGSGSDPHPSRVKTNEQTNLLDRIMALAEQGTTTARPTAGKYGRFYWDTTVARLYWDDGAAWQEVSTNGGGGAGGAIVPGVAGKEGASARSARADHTHALALVTPTSPGAMSAADKAAFDTATSSSAANTLVVRDGSGRSQFSAPSAGADAANKSYVDTQVSTSAPKVHKHAAADVDSGVFATARIPVGTASAPGSMSAADKAKLDTATEAATPSAIMRRDASGRVRVQEPAAAADVATMGYVDRALGNYSQINHTHTWEQIKDKPTTFAPIVGGASNQAKPGNWVPSWSDVTGKPTTFAPSAHTHSAADVTSGVFAVARIPAHTQAWSQVTGTPSTYPPSAHTHSAADINAGVFAPAQLPLATPSANGAMSAADKTRLDSASYELNGVSIPLRTAEGWLKGSVIFCESSEPQSGFPNAVTRKDYVDGRINTRAPSSHTHTWGSVTGKPGTFPPTPHGHMWTAITNTNVIYNTNAGTGSYRAMWVNSAGVVGYNLSSEKYKTNIEDYAVPLSLLDVVTPKRFQYKADVAELGDAAPGRVNFIAEDMHDAGLTEYVSYDGEGTARENVETINEQLVVNALWSFAQQHNTMLADVARRLEAGGL